MNTLVLRILAVALLLFSVIRVLLWAVYPDYFAQVQLGGAMLTGVLFDGKLTVLILSPLLLMLLFPFAFLNRSGVRRGLAWLCFAVLSCVGLLALADVAYFGEVQRHIGSELLNIGNDLGFIIGAAFGSRWHYTVAAFFGVLLLWLLWRCVVMPVAVRVQVSGKLRLSWGVLQLVLLVLISRGMIVQGRPLATIDAFNNATQEQANLSLNGALLSLEAVYKRQNNTPVRLLDDAAMEKWQAQEPHPFEYRSTVEMRAKNIVFILLESWSYRYIDALAGNNYGVTPNMDKLVAQSRVWDRFYAAGQRSIIGIQAALASVPALPDRAPIGFGLEANGMSRIAALAANQGYRTVMVQSSKRRSFHLDGIAKALGFQEYYGQEDLPLLRPYPQETPEFGWDYEALMFLNKQLNGKQKQPFFAFLFTGTTHEEFANPGQEFLKYPHDRKGEQGFLNTLYYSDWAVGQFMQAAAKQPWYRDTVFVFSADHTLNSGTRPASVAEQFHIPLVVFEPGVEAARYRHLASQYDLLPTFADWMQIKQPVYTFGQSLLQTQRSLPLLLSKGSVAVMFDDAGESAEFQNNQQISGKGDLPQLAYWQWRVQKADQLLRQNRWHMPLSD